MAENPFRKSVHGKPITSIAELKKAIREIKTSADGYVTHIEEIIELINSFEASVKERTEDLEKSLRIKDYPQDKVSVVVDEAILEELVNELRRILGDEDG